MWHGTWSLDIDIPKKSLITHGLVETVKGIHPPELKIVLDRDYVEIQRGGSTTVTATWYAWHWGTLSYALSGPSRVNITWSTILIGAPSSTTAQTYICTVMLAEVVPAEPTPITYTVSAKLTIEVIIPPAPGD